MDFILLLKQSWINSRSPPFIILVYNEITQAECDLKSMDNLILADRLLTVKQRDRALPYSPSNVACRCLNKFRDHTIRDREEAFRSWLKHDPRLASRGMIFQTLAAVFKKFKKYLLARIVATPQLIPVPSSTRNERRARNCRTGDRQITISHSGAPRRQHFSLDRNQNCFFVPRFYSFTQEKDPVGM